MSPFSSYLQEIVYGGTDGIVTTFAVVAGFNGAIGGITNINLPILIVVLFGCANLFADGVSMALGNFLSVRANKDVYKVEKAKELHEIVNSPDMEKAETKHILISKGFSEKQALTLTAIYSKNKNYWLEFMMKDELKLPNPEDENPYLTGLATFLAFVSFGSIPLGAYLFPNLLGNRFLLSILSTFGALLILGLLRFKVTKEHPLRSIGEVVLLGSTSSLVAYFIGTLFRS